MSLPIGPIADRTSLAFKGSATTNFLDFGFELESEEFDALSASQEVARFKDYAKRCVIIFDSGVFKLHPLTEDGERYTEPKRVGELLGGAFKYGGNFKFSDTPSFNAKESPFDQLELANGAEEEFRRLLASITGNRLFGEDSKRIADRLEALLNAVYEEEEEELTAPSVASLQNLVAHLKGGVFSGSVDIVLTPAGNFRAVWWPSRGRRLAIEFLPDGYCRFVLFAPDPSDARRTIRTSGISYVDALSNVLEPYHLENWIL